MRDIEYDCIDDEWRAECPNCGHSYTAQTTAPECPKCEEEGEDE